MDRRGTGPLGGGARRLRADLPAGQAGWERRRPGAGAAAAALGGLAIDHSLQVARPLASGSNEVSSGGRIPTSAARTKTWSASATPPRIGHRVYVLFLSGLDANIRSWQGDHDSQSRSSETPSHRVARGLKP